jgi:aldose 1-epimerase
MAARWNTPSGHQWTIEAGTQRASLVEVGGGVREYTVNGREILAGYPAEKMASKGVGQILAPWPNRIRDGKYTFDGTDHQLSIDEPKLSTAIHGLVRWELWDRIDHTPTSVTLARTVQPRPGYPYALVLRVKWSLGPDGLRVEHQATNVGPDAAPFGLGIHPYLTLGGEPLAEAKLRLPVGRRILVDDRNLPTGKEEPVEGTEWDYREGRVIGSASLDTPFVVTERGSDGVATSTLTDAAGRGAQLWQDESFGWLQVYNGKGPSGEVNHAVAVEPMTCPPDAFNSGEGLVTLAPGAKWEGTWGVRPL